VSLTDLAGRVSSGSSMGRALRRWPRTIGRGGVALEGLDGLIRRLARQRYLVPELTDAGPRLRLDAEWLRMSRMTLTQLGARERHAAFRSGQRLVACATTLSKKSRAATDAGSATI